MARLAGPLLVTAVVATLGAGPGAVRDAASASTASTASTIEQMIEQGREIAFDRRRGNCLACHVMAGATLPGNIGPPLIGMKARFPDKTKLRAQIRDATALNPRSLMPPFGRHEILTEDEIDKVVEYVHSL